MPTTVLDQQTLFRVLDLLWPGVKRDLGPGWDLLGRAERTTIDVIGPDGETIPLLDKAMDIKTGFYKRVFVHRLRAIHDGKRPHPTRGWEEIDDAALG